MPKDQARSKNIAGSRDYSKFSMADNVVGGGKGLQQWQGGRRARWMECIGET